MPGVHHSRSLSAVRGTRGIPPYHNRGGGILTEKRHNRDSDQLHQGTDVLGRMGSLPEPYRRDTRLFRWYRTPL